MSDTTHTDQPKPVRLSRAQEFGLDLIGAGTYWAHEASGGARRHPHRPGVTPIVRRETLLVLAREDLVEYDETRPGRLQLTDAKGTPALAAIRARRNAQAGTCPEPVAADPPAHPESPRRREPHRPRPGGALRR